IRSSRRDHAALLLAGLSGLPGLDKPSRQIGPWPLPLSFYLFHGKKVSRVFREHRPRRVLILVENLPSPFDRRVWQEACALRDAGYEVSIICPTGGGCEKRFELIDSIHIYRYRLPVEASGALGYALEYASAIAQAFILSWCV